MKIWAFPSIYPYDYPGTKWNGIFAHRQYKGLIKCGADLKVIQPVFWHPPFPFSSLHWEWKKLAQLDYPAQRVYDGVTVYHPRISNMRPNRLMKKTYMERYVDTIVQFFKDNNITLDPANDIFYSQWIPEAGFAQAAAHKLGLKSAVYSIGDDVVVYPYSNPGNKALFVQTMKEADARFSVADYLARETNEIVGENLPYDVIHLGADYNKFKPGTSAEKAEIKKQYNIPEGKTVILHVGSSIVRKGWLDLLDAAAAIKKTNNNFVIAAVHTPPYDLDLPAEAAKRGLADNFISIGEVAPEKLHTVFRAADIFCIPSHWEGIAVVVMESMASGLPVLTTNVCGHPELVNDGVTGMLVPPKRIDLLTEKLSLLLSDAALRTRLGSAAREYMVNVWGSFDDIAVTLYKKLQETLAK